MNQTIHVRLRRFAANAIPVVGRDRWLFERWSETDRWITSRAHRAEEPR